VPSGMVLGVATAVSWGSADFLARFATRSVGSVRALLGMQFWGAIFVTILLFFARDWGHLFDGSGWEPWAWGILAGSINSFAMLALYRAFEIGKLSLVGPVSASYPALSVILSLLSGERLSAYRATGIAAALLGVVFVAAGEKLPDSPAVSDQSNKASTDSPKSRGIPGHRVSGLGWAIAAAISFAILFWLLGIRMIPRTGALATVWLIRVSGALITLIVLLANRIPLPVKNKSTRAQLYTMGCLDTAAFALSNLGMRIEQVAVVSVLGSLYGAVTVALAAAFLKERIAPMQWTGIAAIFLGVALMNA
jgi:drug/metabolite transporter (DMT)-like permease